MYAAAGRRSGAEQRRLRPDHHPAPEPCRRGQPSFGADVSLRVDSLAARNDRGSIRAAHTRARLLQPLRLRVKVYSATPHDDFSHVLVYDGDPEKGGQMIAGKLLTVVTRRGPPPGSSGYRAAWGRTRSM